MSGQSSASSLSPFRPLFFYPLSHLLSSVHPSMQPKKEERLYSRGIWVKLSLRISNCLSIRLSVQLLDKVVCVIFVIARRNGLRRLTSRCRVLVLLFLIFLLPVISRVDATTTTTAAAAPTRSSVSTTSHRTSLASFHHKIALKFLHSSQSLFPESCGSCARAGHEVPAPLVRDTIMSDT